jgi:hypothetical protein
MDAVTPPKGRQNCSCIPQLKISMQPLRQNGIAVFHNDTSGFVGGSPGERLEPGVTRRGIGALTLALCLALCGFPALP